MILQVTIGVALLSVAGHLLGALNQASRVDSGFETQGIYSFELRPQDRIKQTGEQILDELRALPGVRNATFGTNLPVGAPLNYPLRLPGKEMSSLEFRGVDAGYFNTLGISVDAGRALRDSDRESGLPVAVVNRAFIKLMFDAKQSSPDLQAGLGQTLLMPMLDQSERELRIVGVVGDTRQYGPEQPAPAIVYMPFDQIPGDLVEVIAQFAPLRFAVASEVPTEAIAGAIRAIAGRFVPNQPVQIESLEDALRATTRQTRANLMLIAVFAGLGLILSTVGLYSVVAVAAGTRTREFAIRAVVGATALQLFQRVMRDGMLQGAIGLVLGLLIGWWGMRTLGSVLPGEVPFDPAVACVVALISMTTTVIASTHPAIRSARVNLASHLRAS